MTTLRQQFSFLDNVTELKLFKTKGKNDGPPMIGPKGL